MDTANRWGTSSSALKAMSTGRTARPRKSRTTPPPWLLYEQFTGSQKQGWDGSLRLRAGVLVTPQTLVYATGGLAIGQVSGTFSYYGADSAGAAVYGAASWSETRVGGTIGAGVETALGAGMKARAEYRYTNLGKFSKDVPLANNDPVACPAWNLRYHCAHRPQSDQPKVPGWPRVRSQLRFFSQKTAPDLVRGGFFLSWSTRRAILSGSATACCPRPTTANGPQIAG